MRIFSARLSYVKIIISFQVFKKTKLFFIFKNIPYVCTFLENRLHVNPIFGSYPFCDNNVFQIKMFPPPPQPTVAECLVICKTIKKVKIPDAESHPVRVFTPAVAINRRVTTPRRHRPPKGIWYACVLQFIYHDVQHAQFW